MTSDFGVYCLEITFLKTKTLFALFIGQSIGMSSTTMSWHFTHKTVRANVIDSKERIDKESRCKEKEGLMPY